MANEKGEGLEKRRGEKQPKIHREDIGGTIKPDEIAGTNGQDEQRKTTGESGGYVIERKEGLSDMGSRNDDNLRRRKSVRTEAVTRSVK